MGRKPLPGGDQRDLRRRDLLRALVSPPNIELKRQIELYLETYCTILGVTPEIAKHAGLLRGELGRRGKVRAQADMLIAATASAHGLTLATRNERDFDGCGVAIYNPFR